MFVCAVRSVRKSYVEIVRLLLSLLSEGLPCLSQNASADTNTKKNDADTDTEDAEEVERCVVRTLGAAVRAIGAVAESYRLDNALCVKKDGGVVHMPPSTGDPVVAATPEREVFLGLLCQVLSLVTAGVCRDVVPRMEHGAATGGTVSQDMSLVPVVYGLSL